MKYLLPIAFITFIACNGGPPPPPPPPPTCDLWSAPEGCECPSSAPFAPQIGVCAPPRADRQVDWGYVRGVTAFSLAMQNIHFIADFTYYVHENGWTTLRVGAQTSHDWCAMNMDVNPFIGANVPSRKVASMSGTDIYAQLAGYLPCGPPHGSLDADRNLIRLLEVTARIPDTWVELIPTFTYKSHDEGTQAKNVAYFNAMFDHVNSIVKEGGYKHVIWEAFNEVVHPMSQHIKDEDVREILLHMRANTDLPVGTDYDGNFQNEDPWAGRYPFIWRDAVNFIAFHTPRNPEPSYDAMRTAQERWRYSTPVFVDETVAWASDEEIAAYNLQGKGTIAQNGYGTNASRMEQVRVHLGDIARTGWIPLFHSIWGIQCLRVSEMPNYERDIKP